MSLAALTAATTELTALRQALLPVAQVRADLQAEFAARQAQMGVTFWVDPAAGLDTAAGTEAAPLRTVTQALARTPVGGRCEVRLTGPLEVAGQIRIDRRDLLVRSSSSTRHAVTFGRTAAGGARSTGHFYLMGRATFTAMLVRIVQPALAGFEGTTLDADAACIRAAVVPSDGATGRAGVSLGAVDVELPATAFAPLMGGTPLSLAWWNNTLVGAVSSVRGRLHELATSVSGTATATLPWLHTNLSEV